MYPFYRKAALPLGLYGLSLFVAGTVQAGDQSGHASNSNKVVAEAKKRVKRAQTVSRDVRWPNRIVPYVLTNATPKAREVFLEAAREISRNSALRFVERTDEADYIYLANDHHNIICASAVGKEGGPQELSLSPSCHNVGDALHELMHVVGFYHEHQRVDRDQYLKVGRTLFASQYNTDKDGLSIGPYDLDSVTHYETGNELKLRDPSTRVRPWPRTTLSAGDIAALDALYGGVAKNTGPAPTDNNLGVVLSKQELVLAENTAGQVEVRVLSSVPLAGIPQIKSENPLIAVSIDSQTANTFTLKVQAEPGATTQPDPTTQATLDRVFFHFSTAEGKNGVVVFHVSIVKPEELPASYRQLVSLWKPVGSTQKQCLEARRLPAKVQHFPTAPDVEVFAAFMQDDQLSLVLAPCDSNKSLQLWKQSAEGHLINKTEAHCLGAVGAVSNLSLPTSVAAPRACDSNTPPTTAYQWRYVDGRLINVAYPRAALTYPADGVPSLFPVNTRPVPWQQWVWY
ncbi:M12 family metallopeptidase [Chitinimonas sp. PSY-7]|uniref:M12 family metallopeptidase n=1 Tax=Chitinimonas sp. PSY-7 TaxID=3459088 RepID=UPI00403FE1DD